MRGVSTLAEAWFQAIVITPGRSRRSRRFIHSTRRRGFHRGRDHWSVRCWRRDRSERSAPRLNLAHAEVLQLQHGQVALFQGVGSYCCVSRPWSQAATYHPCLLPSVPALPVTRVFWI